jgi:hypothetical protein
VPRACHSPDSTVPFVKVRVVAENIRTASPTVQRIGMLLITTFVELRVVAGRSRKVGRSPTCRLWTADSNSHVMPMHHRVVALRSRFQNGMVVAWHGRGMAYVNLTRLHCVKWERRNINP